MGRNRIPHFFFWVGCTLILIAGRFEVPAQSPIGQAEVITFSRNQYRAGAQNWEMASDPNHRLYVANNEGILVFNGKEWQVFPVPNRTIVRSLCFGPESRLYVGAQNEFGYFTPDARARLQFTSLRHLLPGGFQSFSDVWQTRVLGKAVFFQTRQAIFRYDGRAVQVFGSGSGWNSLHVHAGKVLAHEGSQGLMQFDQNQWKVLIPASELPPGFQISGLAPFGTDTSLVCTARNGLFYLIGQKLLPFKAADPAFPGGQTCTALWVLPDKNILAGTYFNGLYILSPQGRVLGNISRQSGLRNLTIRCLFADPTGKVWMGLDNGLAFFEFEDPIHHINPPGFNNGIGYRAEIHRGDLYFALSTGLKWSPTREEVNLHRISTAPRSIVDGLTWNVSTVRGRLLAARDDGFWHIRDHRAFPVSQSTGYWTFRDLGAKRGMVAGSYQGIQFYSLQNPDFSPGQKWLIESSRYIEVDTTQGLSIWISHPYRGVYRVDTNGKTTWFGKKQGFPEDLNNHVFSIKGKICFATTSGVYAFDRGKNRMVPSPDFTSIFGRLSLRYLREDPTGNVWFVHEKKVGLVEYTAASPRIHYFPELDNKMVSGFENIFPYNNRNVFVGSDDGFYHLNFEKYKEKIRPFSVYLTQIKTIGEQDSLLFGGFPRGKKGDAGEASYPYRLNSLRFSFAAAIFDPRAHPEFSYWLEGFDQTWCAWTPKPEKDYTNLPPGTYTFRLKSRRSPSHESGEFGYEFTIDPPFYQTVWAYLVYFLVFLGFLYLILKIQARRYKKRQEARRRADQQRFEEEQRQMAYQHQLELEQSEKEFIRIQNEKLEAEIAHKNAELASAAMNLVQKKEFILKMKAELQQLQRQPDSVSESPELKKMLKTISEEEKLNKEWDHFAQHFNSVYGDFLTILKGRFPGLKPHEMQLCAYLRMNLSSKEIAPLMSISVRGVEIGRYRLRKKLNLSTEENLVQFLMELKA